MELVWGGRLTDLIKQKFDQCQRFSDKEASSLLKGILNAVAYIHEKGIVHRDLKPGKLMISLTDHSHLENILIEDTSDLTTVKIADFGLSAKHVTSQGGLYR